MNKKNFHQFACNWQENQCEQMRQHSGWRCCCQSDACNYLSDAGCTLSKRKRTKLCNLYLCESALSYAQGQVEKSSELKEKKWILKNLQKYHKKIIKYKNKEKHEKLIKKHQNFVKY